MTLLQKVTQIAPMRRTMQPSQTITANTTKIKPSQPMPAKHETDDKNLYLILLRHLLNPNPSLGWIDSSTSCPSPHHRIRRQPEQCFALNPASPTFFPAPSKCAISWFRAWDLPKQNSTAPTLCWVPWTCATANRGLVIGRGGDVGKASWGQQPHHSRSASMANGRWPAPSPFPHSVILVTWTFVCD